MNIGMFGSASTKVVIRIAAFIAILVSGVAISDQAILTLSVRGMILPPPKWVDPVGQELTSIVFNMNGYARTGPPKPVDSDIQFAKLINAPSYPADIHMMRPQNCSIGADQVRNRDVVLRIDKKDFMRDQTIRFPDDQVRQLQLSFHERGAYQDKTGIVRCQAPGRLVYQY
jgi:hypothetical protein